MRAKVSSSTDTELSICSFLAEKGQKDQLAKHVVMLLDSFEHTGPNGTHRCPSIRAYGCEHSFDGG
jgi:hypothetical protein